MEDAKIKVNEQEETVVEVNPEDVTVIENKDITIVESQEVVEAPLPREDAERLTKDIQATTTALYVLLKRAHDTKAWISMGYNSWTEYIEKEFDFSRARSYQLINQANVIEEIHEASGTPLYITEREARDIKKRLPEITERLERDVKEAGLTGEEAEEKVKQIIEGEEDKRENIDNANSYKGDSKGGGDGWDDPEDFDEGEDTSPGYSDNGGYSLSDDDKFYYENLLVTLKIFESMPNASLFGEKIKKSNGNRKELIKLAEDSHEWITKLLGQIK